MVEIFNTIAEVDTAALGLNASLELISVVTNPAVRNFMLKNLETWFHMKYPDVDDRMLVILADSDATVAQISAAMATTVQDLEAGVDYSTGQRIVRRVWSIGIPEMHGAVNGDVVTWHHEWKLPPKGVPVLKGRGLSLFAFNMDAGEVFTNGPTVTMVAKAMGGWF